MRYEVSKACATKVGSAAEACSLCLLRRLKQDVLLTELYVLTHVGQPSHYAAFAWNLGINTVQNLSRPDCSSILLRYHNAAATLKSRCQYRYQPTCIDPPCIWLI